MDEEQAQKPRGILSKIFKRDDWDGKRRFRWQQRPLTPEEEAQQRLEEAHKKLQEEQRLAVEAEKRKKEAYNKLRIAVDFLDVQLFSPKITKSEHGNHLQLAVLSQASDYLEQARRLDPTARITRTIRENDPPMECTIDLIAVNILGLEAQLHLNNADTAMTEGGERAGRVSMTGDRRALKEAHARMDREMREHTTKAYNALKKLLDYQPNNIGALRSYASALFRLDREKEALQVAERALALDPDDIESIKLVDGMK